MSGGARGRSASAAPRPRPDQPWPACPCATVPLPLGRRRSSSPTAGRAVGARGRPASPLPARDGSGQVSARVRPRLRYSSLRSPSLRFGATAACPAPRLLRSIPAAALLQAVLLSPHQILRTQRLCPQDLDLLALFLLEPLPSSNIPAELFLQRSTVDSILGGVAAPTPPKPLWKAVALLPQRAAQLQLVCPFCILPIPNQQPLLATSEWIRSFFL